MNIGLWTISQMTTFVLVLVRVAGIFTVAPIFGNVNVAPMVRVGRAACLAFVFLPMAQFDASGLEFLPFLLVVVKEALIGIVMGFLASMIFTAIQMAGSYIDLQVGFGFANVVDPMMKHHSAVIGQLYNFAATLLFLALNGHHLMIRGLADSFAVLPLGSATLSAEATSTILQIFVVLFVASLKIGAPVIGAIFLTDVSLGILARTVPQLNVLVVGFPAKLTVGMLAVFAALPLTLAVMTRLFGGLERDIVRLLRFMGG
ncbi:MAG: flagellar type III secretion system protein FliR [Armatimonadetes bacterium]|nr:flagellar type III secretion system protein FliR [Armatimonadota bacterium]